MPLIVATDSVGHQRLIAKHSIVCPRYSGDKIPGVGLSLTLQVVLSATEIPHEIAHIHIANLITKEIAHVLHKSGSRQSTRSAFTRSRVGHHHKVAISIDSIRDLNAVHILGSHAGPSFVGIDVRRAEDARQDHVEFGSHDIFIVVVVEEIAVATTLKQRGIR